LNPFYAVAALALLASVHSIPANANDVPTASAPSCEISEPLNPSHLSPELLAARGATFMKVCTESNGELIDTYDSRLVHNLTQPGKMIGPIPTDFYPAESIKRDEQGTIYISCVVETNGRTSSVAVLKSSRIVRLDKTALKWAKVVVFSSPAYLDFTPIRVFTVLRVVFSQK
jgi:TonB family protein